MEWPAKDSGAGPVQAAAHPTDCCLGQPAGRDPCRSGIRSCHRREDSCMRRSRCRSASSAAISSCRRLTEDDRDVSVARIWNEVLLEAIRNDFARPTVHARNLWHTLRRDVRCLGGVRRHGIDLAARQDASRFRLRVRTAESSARSSAGTRGGDQLRCLPHHPASFPKVARAPILWQSSPMAAMAELGYDIRRHKHGLRARLAGGARQPYRRVLHRLRDAGRCERGKRLRTAGLRASQSADRTGGVRQSRHRRFGSDGRRSR